MTYAERQIVRMLIAGMRPIDIIAAIESGEHLRFKPAQPQQPAAKEAA